MKVEKVVGSSWAVSEAELSAGLRGYFLKLSVSFLLSKADSRKSCDYQPPPSLGYLYSWVLTCLQQAKVADACCGKVDHSGPGRHLCKELHAYLRHKTSSWTVYYWCLPHFHLQMKGLNKLPEVTKGQIRWLDSDTKAHHSLSFTLRKHGIHIDTCPMSKAYSWTPNHMFKGHPLPVPRSQSFYLQSDFSMHHERHQTLAKDYWLAWKDKRIVWGLADSWVNLRPHSMAGMPLPSGPRGGIIGHPGGAELSNSAASWFLASGSDKYTFLKSLCRPQCSPSTLVEVVFLIPRGATIDIASTSGPHNKREMASLWDPSCKSRVSCGKLLLSPVPRKWFPLCRPCWVTQEVEVGVPQGGRVREELSGSLYNGYPLVSALKMFFVVVLILVFGKRKVLNCGVQESKEMVLKHGPVSPSSASQNG